ncbi:MAG TPA: glycerol-3-phosphate 1-O-acyltransferase PlsB [Rhodanobacteraceae bacterium]|nr:glycerol-3-phosphate 1-O-acyltransferase PlsB [Rhodanobacteraceae bacterium]
MSYVMAQIPSRDDLVHAGWWRGLWGAVLAPWARIKRDPAEPAALLVPDTPVIYVIERGGFTDSLLLERACREAGLPSPLAVMPGFGRRRRSAFAMRGTGGWLRRRDRGHAAQDSIRQLLRLLEAAPERNVQLMPVAIYVGRAPNRQSGWFSVLFSENWAVVGHFRRLLALLLNGRDSIVRFSPPISLSGLRADAAHEPLERLQRKLARVLRVHFRRVRAAVIGPDLSHRRTVVDAVLNAESVRNAIAATAAREGISQVRAWRRAQKLMNEIAADYSQPFVRSISFFLANFWNKLYDGIAMHHFDSLRAIAPDYEVVYVPSHRSHADYILLSFWLYESGVVVPHIAAGVNLNLPVLGPLLRRGGAFFLRRSFRGNALYSVVFKEYMAQLLERGVPIEYFIEGTRSRTGRLLAPRFGLLSMTVRAFLRAPRRPVLFQPVYIGYEKLMEGRAYIGELSGQKKERESWMALLRGARKVLRQRFGRVTLNFGEPIELNAVLDAANPDWRDAGDSPDSKPEWLNHALDHLGAAIQVNTNRAADINPINLVALALLGSPRHALAEADLVAQLELMKAILVELPYSDRTTVTPMAPGDIVAYAEQMGWIRRIQHPLGDVLAVDGEKAVLLSYFRNNVLHVFAAGAWVACCFINNRRITRDTVRRLGRAVYPFIQSELFLPWDSDGFEARVDAVIEFLLARGLLAGGSGDARLYLAAGREDDAYQLRLLAHCLLQAFERYYIAVAALVKNGPHTLSAGQLENLCQLAAQRLSLLYQQSAPEFFDKSLFRGFIQKLRERHIVWTDAAGKLDFDAVLNDVARDAKVILAREVRQSIMKITPDVVSGETTD